MPDAIAPLTETQARWLATILPRLLPLGFEECQPLGTLGGRLVLTVGESLRSHAELLRPIFEPLIGERLQEASQGRLRGVILQFEEEHHA